MAEHGIEMVRYADDFVVLCRTAEDAARALDLITGWVNENGLTIHPTKTRIVDARTTPFDFLGHTFCGQEHGPRKKSIQKLRDTIREKTPRTNERSMQCAITDVNRVLKGWFAYFKHSSRRWIYARQDGWVRMRLRSILRRRGHGHGWDHIRWPNTFFAEHGLYSLVTAHASAVQSSRR
jgi:RNA-directed DNA polymerase